MLNWSKVVPLMSQDLQSFVARKLSGENLYKRAVSLGIGPEVRTLTRSGVDRARRATREALRRRNLLNR